MSALNFVPKALRKRMVERPDSYRLDLVMISLAEANGWNAVFPHNMWRHPVVFWRENSIITKDGRQWRKDITIHTSAPIYFPYTREGFLQAARITETVDA